MTEEKNIFTKIKEGFQVLFFVWKEELRRVFKDSGVLIFFFLVPLGYPLIYAFIYDNEVMHEAKLVVVDESATAMSREFTRRMDATSEVHVVQTCTDMAEAKQLMDRKEAYAILHFPASFSDDVHRGTQTHVSLYSDMSALLFYKAFMLATTETSLNMAEDFQKEMIPASTEELQKITIKPIPYESVTMFNPQGGFSSFIVPAILVLIIQQTLVLGICMLGGTAREKSPYQSLVPTSQQFHGTLRILLGKAFAYALIYVIVCVWIFAFVPKLFALPQIGNPLDMLYFLIPYVFASIFMAITLSGFMISRESPMLIFVFASVVLLFISGISWPKEAVPWYWKAVGYIFPSTPAVQGFVRINSTGAMLQDVLPEYHLLWIQCGAYFVSSFVVYRRQIIKLKEKLNLN